MNRKLVLTAVLLATAGTGFFVLRFHGPSGMEQPPGPGLPPREETPPLPPKWSHELPARPSRESLSSLRRELLSLPEDQAAAEISRFLATGEDRPTGLDFAIGESGNLSGWPTLRVFLLDLLPTLDPAAAAALGREVLAKPTTADEWALALRNVARGELAPESRAYLKAKTAELIKRPEWQAEPSVGFLNAFDVLVHTAATDAEPLLSDLIRNKDRRDLAHAGFLTLDRLVQREPAEMLARLKADTALQASRPEMVAQQFARADLRVEAQRELVRGWLLDPARSAVELENFAGIYPNNNQMVSNNLLTSEPRVSGADLAAHDREALGLIRQWQQDPAFASRAAVLDEMAARLSQFVEESATPVSAPPGK